MSVDRNIIARFVHGKPVIIQNSNGKSCCHTTMENVSIVVLLAISLVII
jgi:hypothetical protein